MKKYYVLKPLNQDTIMYIYDLQEANQREILDKQYKMLKDKPNCYILIEKSIKEDFSEFISKCWLLQQGCDTEISSEQSKIRKIIKNNMLYDYSGISLIIHENGLTRGFDTKNKSLKQVLIDNNFKTDTFIGLKVEGNKGRFSRGETSLYKIKIDLNTNKIVYESYEGKVYKPKPTQTSK